MREWGDMFEQWSMSQTVYDLYLLVIEKDTQNVVTKRDLMRAHNGALSVHNIPVGLSYLADSSIIHVTEYRTVCRSSSWPKSIN